jgi:ABC-type Mn2+/Zn2+ transport system ATPase subunit
MEKEVYESRLYQYLRGDADRLVQVCEKERRMTFTYRVEDRILLENVNLPLESGTLTLITGVENQSFGLLGGIVSGLFPIENTEHIPNIEELVRVFTGTLEIAEGVLPDRAVYLGPDPERHLLFARVEEELNAQMGTDNDPAGVLERFHLDEVFLDRRISSLSGGEKMKLALSIAFSKAADCTVLHGIVPWLDDDGRTCLVQEIFKSKEDDRCVLVMEQEIDVLLPHADRIFYFNGHTLLSPEGSVKNRLSGDIVRVSRTLGGLMGEKSTRGTAVAFRNVRFGYKVDGERGFELSQLSFVLEYSSLYALIGNNGAGKSTIANLILRLETPQEGCIHLFGEPLISMDRKRLMERVCYVSQFPEQHITLSNVQQYRSRAKKRNNALSFHLLDNYFDPREEYPLSQLSPLQMKVLSLASSVASTTKLIILDEPTWGIDPTGLHEFLDFLTHAVQALETPSILIITHDVALVGLLGAEIILLEKGALVPGETTEVGDSMEARA